MKNKVIEKKLKENYVFFVTAFISLFVLLLCLIMNKCVPYGENFPLTGMSFSQTYAEFVNAIKNIQSGKGIGFLDYGTGLVTDNYSIKSYSVHFFILRPWMYLVCKFVPESMYIIAFAVPYYLTFIFSGLLFIYYLCHRRTGFAYKKTDSRLILLGLAYTMSTCSTSFFIYLGFRFTIFLPIILLALERLVYDKKYIVYTISLAYFMALDAYSAFMLCVFILCYFFVLNFEGIKDFLGKLFRVGCYSIVSVFLSAGVLLPYYIRTSYSPYGNTDNSIPSLISWFGNIILPLSDYCPLKYGVITASEEYRSNLYCGLFAFLLLPIYFSLKNEKKTVIIRKGILLGVLYLSFDNELINYVFHGFHHQWQVPNRFSSFFVFVLLSILADVLHEKDAWKKKNVIYSVTLMTVVIFLIYGWAAFLRDGEGISLVSFIPGFIFGIIYIAVLILFGINKKNISSYVFFIVAILEVTISGMYDLSASMKTESLKTEVTVECAEKISRFSDITSDMADPFVISERPGVFDNQNISYLSGTHSISYYSSTNYKQTSDLLFRWGMLFSTNQTYYTTGSPLSDMMLHVKYHITDSNDMYTYSPYRVIGTCDNLLLHQNDYALPLGIVLSRNTMLDEWNERAGSYSGYSSAIDRENAFANVFDVDDIYSSIEINRINEISEAISQEKNYCLVTEDGYGGAIYAFLLGKETGGDAYMDVAGSLEYIGSSEIGQSDTLYFYASQVVYNSIKNESHICILNKDNFSKLYGVLSNNVMMNHKYSSESISGEVKTKENSFLYLAMPYLPGFKAFIDGKECEIKNYMDAVALDIPAGNHHVELRYKPKGMMAGLVLSLITIVLFTGYSIFCNKELLREIKRRYLDDIEDIEDKEIALERKYDIKRNLLIMSCCLLFFFLYIILGYVRYETNDDIGFNTIAAGYMGNNSEKLFFINVLFGYILKALYSFTKNINWYLCTILALNLIAIVTICYALTYRIKNIFLSILITVMVNVTIGKQLYNLVQFTKTAAVLLVAGFVIIACYEKNSKGHRPALFLGIILFIIGYWIRSECLALLLPYFVVYIVFDSIHIYHNSKKSMSRVMVNKYFIPSVFIIFGIILSFSVNYLSQRSGNWREYWNYHEARAELCDNGAPVYDMFSDFYDSLGWDYSEVALFVSWISIDDSFSYDNIHKICDFKSQVEKNYNRLNEDYIDEYFDAIFEKGIKTFKYWYIYLTIIVLVIILVGKSGLLVVLSNLIILLGEYAYLVYIYKVEWRVCFSIWFCFIILSGLFLCQYYKTTGAIDKIGNKLLDKRVKRISVSTILCTILTAILLLDRISVLSSEFVDFKGCKVIYQKDNPCADFIDYTIDDDKTYILDTKTFFDIYRSVWDIVGDQEDLNKKYVSSGGWMIPSPTREEYFDYNVPTLSDLYTKDNVYFVSSSETEYLVLSLLCDKYDANISMEIVEEYKGLKVWKYYIDN